MPPPAPVALPQADISREDLEALMDRHNLVAHRQSDGTIVLRQRAARAQRRKAHRQR